MSHIPPIDQVMRSLRVQPLLEKAASQELKKSNVGTKTQGARQTSADAASYVIQQIQSISGEDPQRRRRAFRAFLEGRMIDMLGKKALHTPAFHNMLDQVHHAMSANKEMARAMDGVADFLLANQLDPATLGRLATAFHKPTA